MRKMISYVDKILFVLKGSRCEVFSISFKSCLRQGKLDNVCMMCAWGYNFFILRLTFSHLSYLIINIELILK